MREDGQVRRRLPHLKQVIMDRRSLLRFLAAAPFFGAAVQVLAEEAPHNFNVATAPDETGSQYVTTRLIPPGAQQTFRSEQGLPVVSGTRWPSAGRTMIVRCVSSHVLSEGHHFGTVVVVRPGMNTIVLKLPVESCWEAMPGLELIFPDGLSVRNLGPHGVVVNVVYEVKP